MERVVGLSVYWSKDDDAKFSFSFSKAIDKVDSLQRSSLYGEDLATILLFFIFETHRGDFELESIKLGTKIGRYNANDKSIRVIQHVSFGEIEHLNVDEQVDFFVKKVINGLTLLKAKIQKSRKNTFNFDFDRLIFDLTE
jgi:hypothetical protein